MVKSDSPDRYEGGNECKTEQRQTVPPQASTHQPENQGEEQASHDQKSDDEFPLEYPALFIPTLKLRQAASGCRQHGLQV